MRPEIHGRFEGGFGWSVRPGEFTERSSTAFGQGGRVWLIDPMRADGIDEEIARLGKVEAVVMTVGWHDRDVDWFAALHGVPVYAHRRLRVIDVKSPVERIGDAVPDSPLRVVECSGRGLLRFWTETAIWWPERRALATGDALGTAGYFVQPHQQIAVHPLRRLAPPVELQRLEPQRLYPGHGRSVDHDVAAQIWVAIHRARPDLAHGWLEAAKYVVRRGGSLRG